MYYPAQNRGNKDPDNLISDRFKHYGTTFSVYDNDTAEEGQYNITANGMVNKIIEVKRASIDVNGIVELPYTKPGQLQYLFYNFYGSFLAYCIVGRKNKSDKEYKEFYYYYLVSPCNYRGAVEEELLGLQFMTEEEFAWFVSPNGTYDGTKELSNIDIRKEIKGYRYYRTDGSYKEGKEPEYQTIERVLQVANTNKNKQPERNSITHKIEAKLRQQFYEKYISLQQAVLGSTS